MSAQKVVVRIAVLEARDRQFVQDGTHASFGATAIVEKHWKEKFRLAAEDHDRLEHAESAIANELGIPVKLVGLGEGADDLIVFDPDEFVEALFA